MWRERDPGRAAEIEIQAGMQVEGDRALLRAVLMNLMENAWKFTAKTERARIQIAEAESELGEQKFFVRDNGAGFDMDRAAKLFEPFERLHREGEFPGTGIGLATVKRIVAKHGGRIWAESRPGQGATFWFTISEF
jgi:signal transduction histidine kinase